ncbi:MAG: thioredoxin domain-containing protein [Magnetococcales bacterium]|nr:thioredoxin domain-containing protein [Magnetococcales bacterium]
MEQRANALIHSSSPYLLQHAHNPVDWHPWGEEALALAREENKLLFVSIGYSACHWCHVMEEESFQDPQVGDLLRRWFVSIKVDREERPDVDHHFMQRLLALNGNGGWPMSLFLTPDLHMLYAGTYFPPQARHGLPSFKDILFTLGNQWHQHPDWTTRQALALHEELRQALNTPRPSKVVDFAKVVDRVATFWQQRMDPKYGGFGDHSKFPQPVILLFLQRYAREQGRVELQRQLAMTLEHMAAGGLRDQLAGCFHRYTVDRYWHLPHFEIMLTDNALLARTYLEAWQTSQNLLHATVVEGILRDVQQRFLLPDLCFASSLDADSEGEEGKYYSWNKEEIFSLLGPQAGKNWCQYWLNQEVKLESGEGLVRWMADLDGKEFIQHWSAFEESRKTLYHHRSQRVAPALDDKVITSWNGMMISAFARAAAVMDRPDWLATARAAMESLLVHNMHNQRLIHSRRGDRVQSAVFLEDYAFVILALLDLYQVDFSPQDLQRAVGLAREMVERFQGEEGEPFYQTPIHEPSSLPAACILEDDALPSGQSGAILSLLRLAALTGDASFAANGERILQGLSGYLAERGGAAVALLEAVDYLPGNGIHMVITGVREDGTFRQMLQKIRHAMLPGLSLLWQSPCPNRPSPAISVCQGTTCLPTAQGLAEVEVLLKKLLQKKEKVVS